MVSAETADVASVLIGAGTMTFTNYFGHLFLPTEPIGTPLSPSVARRECTQAG
jgi:hypothetical protein